jgi:hypothetical protein
VRAQLTVDERRARGTDAANRAPASAHAGWTPGADRRSPLALLAEQATSREPDLVPVRHGRMLVSPFTFYRGAATVMAEDLRQTPTAGLTVQLCGDAHLVNFGVFGSPERRLVFDLNDFDETLPGPFEYDVKRLAASLVIAARDNGFTAAEGREAALASVSAYRAAMARFAGMPTMDVWYASLDEDKILGAVRDAAKAARKSAGQTKGAQREQARQQAKMAKNVDASRHFYWRQLRDMKGSVAVEAMTPVDLALYAQACGWTLARAHARSGDPIAIAAYLGDSDEFDRACTDFAQAYADQNERDYADFAAAVRSGELAAVEGL